MKKLAGIFMCAALVLVCGAVFAEDVQTYERPSNIKLKERVEELYKGFLNRDHSNRWAMAALNIQKNMSKDEYVEFQKKVFSEYRSVMYEKDVKILQLGPHAISRRRLLLSDNTGKVSIDCQEVLWVWIDNNWFFYEVVSFCVNPYDVKGSED